MQLKKYIFPIIAFCYAVFLGYTIYAANTRTPFFFIEFIRHIPCGDKIGHFCLIGSMSFLLNLALKIRKVNIANINLLLGSLIMFITVSLEEMTQLFIASRTFDLVDLFFNYLGIFVFSILAKFVGKYIWTDEK
jgi:hypothetical protein